MAAMKHLRPTVVKLNMLCKYEFFGSQEIIKETKMWLGKKNNKKKTKKKTKKNNIIFTFIPKPNFVWKLKATIVECRL